MKLKKGVKITGIKPELVLAITVVNDEYTKYGKELVITSIMDGKHSRKSLHYTGCAIDTRTRYFTDLEKLAIADDIRKRLGHHFDVIVETNHMHIEFQPQHH